MPGLESEQEKDTMNTFETANQIQKGLYECTQKLSEHTQLMALICGLNKQYNSVYVSVISDMIRMATPMAHTAIRNRLKKSRNRLIIYMERMVELYPTLGDKHCSLHTDILCMIKTTLKQKE